MRRVGETAEGRQRHIKRFWPQGRRGSGQEKGRAEDNCGSISVSWNYGHDLAIMLLKYAAVRPREEGREEEERPLSCTGCVWTACGLHVLPGQETATGLANCKTFRLQDLCAG